MGDFSLKLINNSSERKKISLFQLGAINESTPQEGLVLGIRGGAYFYQYWMDIGDVYNYIGATLIDDNTYRIVDPTTIVVANTSTNSYSRFVQTTNGIQVPYIVFNATGFNFNQIIEQLKLDWVVANTTNGYLGLTTSNISIDITCRVKLNNLQYFFAPDLKITYTGIPIENFVLGNGSNFVAILDFKIFNDVTSAEENTQFPYSIATAISEDSYYLVGLVSPNGMQVDEDGGVDYQEFLNSQNGNCYSIGSMSVQTFDTDGFSGEEKFTQLLNPISFNKKNTNGNNRSYHQIVSLDPYQIQGSVRNISLGEKSNDFVLDGSVSLDYDVEAYAKVSIELTYTKLPNFVFGNLVELQEIAKLNRLQQIKQEELSNEAKKIELVIEQQQQQQQQENINIDKLLKESKKKDIKDILIYSCVGLVLYNLLNK